MKVAYAAERYKQLQRLKKFKPFWRYRIGNSRVHREEHVRWDGLILSVDDPWWKTHFPPNGWGCNCYIEALDEIDMRELGKSAPDEAPPDEIIRVKYGDSTIEVPKGIDPGWAYTPGANDTESVLRTLEKADPEIAAQAWDDIKPYLREQLDKEHDGKPDSGTPPVTEIMNTGEKPETPEKLKEKIAEKPKIADKPEYEVVYEKYRDDALSKIESPVSIMYGDMNAKRKEMYDARPWLKFKLRDTRNIHGSSLELPNSPGGESVPCGIVINEDWVKKWIEKGVLENYEGEDGKYYCYEHLTAEQRIKILLCHEIAHARQTDLNTKTCEILKGHTQQHEKLMYELISKVCPEVLNIPRRLRGDAPRWLKLRELNRS